MNGKIVVMNDYSTPFLPNFGSLNIIFNLFKNFNDYSILQINFSFFKSRSIKITERFLIVEILRSKWIVRIIKNLNKITSADFIIRVFSFLDSLFNKEYKQCLLQVTQDANILISTAPYLFLSLKRFGKGKILIYCAHNVEYEYFTKVLRQTFFIKIAAIFVKFIEQHACKYANLIFATSQIDKERMVSLYGVPAEKIYIVPNGVDTTYIKPVSLKERLLRKQQVGLPYEKIIVFIGGSGNEPNLIPVEYIVFDLAKKLPDYYFLVFGGASHSFLLKWHHFPIKPLIPSEKFLSGEGSLGLGWDIYGICDAGEDNIARCTYKSFSCFIRDREVTSLYFKAKALAEPRLSGKVMINNLDYLGIKIEDSWKKFEFSFNSIEEIMIGVDLCGSSDYKSGLLVKDIGYFSKGKQKPISLKNPPLGMYQLGNVIFFGLFYDERKRDILEAMDLAINPMFSGSGTNLKMFDYMAAGLPIVTTEVGARGIEAENRKHLLISPLEKFSYAIEELFQDNNLYATLRTNARQLAEEKYDWKKIARNMEYVIEKQLKDYKDGGNNGA